MAERPSIPSERSSLQMASTQVSRKELYDQVWSEPMLHVAKRYGISDVGLAKICRKQRIPCPPRGYWAKKAAGQSPIQIPLPKSDNDSKIVIRESPESTSKSSLSPDLQQQVAEEIGRPFPIEVRDHLRGAHSLISAANQQSQAIRQGPEGLIVLPDDFPVDVHVSKSLLRRALLIMDALLRAFETRGDLVSAGPCVLLLDVPVRFSIAEALVTHKEEAGPTDFSGRYEFSFSRYRKTLVPSGKLTFQIRDHEEHRYVDYRKSWRDTPNQPLEKRLDVIVAGLLEFAAAVKQAERVRRQAEEVRQQAELRRQEEAQIRAAKRAAILAEKKRFEQLVEDSVRWRKSQTLRQYIQAAQQAHLERHGEILPDSEMAKWLEWACRQADWLDPLTESPASLLDEKVEEENHDSGFRNRW